MPRIVVRVVVVLSLTTLAACGFYALAHDGGEVDWHAVLAEAKDREVEIDANDQQRRLLALQIDRILALFEQGSIGLEQAVRQMETEAVSLYPDYLVFIDVFESGETLTEKLGYNVVRHFHAQHRRVNTSESLHAVRRAEAELRAIVKHELIDMSLVQ